MWSLLLQLLFSFLFIHRWKKYSKSYHYWTSHGTTDLSYFSLKEAVKHKDLLHHLFYASQLWVKERDPCSLRKREHPILKVQASSRSSVNLKFQTFPLTSERLEFSGELRQRQLQRPYNYGKITFIIVIYISSPIQLLAVWPARHMLAWKSKMGSQDGGEGTAEDRKKSERESLGLWEL